MPGKEHVVHPLDPSSPAARKLRTLSDHFTTTHDRFVREFVEGIGKGSEADRMKLHNVTDRAGEYQLSLNRYWSDARDFAKDGYRFGRHGDESKLVKLESTFKEFDRKFEKQLKTWEDITSPAADEYDAEEIHKAGDELRQTIEAAYKKIVPPAGVDPQSQAEGTYLKTISAALAGLTGQVGSRLRQLGAGKSVELITMSSRTKEVLERTKKDPPLEQYKSELQASQDLLSHIAKNKQTATDFAKMWMRQGKIREQLKDTNLKPGDAESLRKELTKINQELEFLNKAADRAEKSKLDEQKITTAREKFGDIDRELNFKRKRTPEEIEALLTRRADAAKVIAELTVPLLPAAAKTIKGDIVEAQNKLDQYQTSLDDAKSAIGLDRVSYWGDVKDSFLSGIETVAGEARKDRFDTVVFGSNLSGQLRDWKTAATKKRLDPAGLQKIAVDLAETLNSYSKRVELEMKGLGDDPSVVQLRNQLQAGLAAIRDSVATELQFLFTHGAFGD